MAAASLSNLKLVSAFAVQQICVVSRRGYASKSGVAGGMIRGGGATMSKTGGEEAKVSASSSSWGPDPVTGYYRPDGHANQIDAAELRETLLKHKTRRN